MPERDRTGPHGRGSGSGKGLGRCSGINAYGFGKGCGCGRSKKKTIINTEMSQIDTTETSLNRVEETEINQ